MSEQGIPPLLSEVAPQPSPAPPSRAKWRWAVHLFLLMAYVLGIGLIGAVMSEETDGAALPPNATALLTVCLGELFTFGLVFGIALLFSRASFDDLLLRWRGGIKPILWGMLHSVLLRIGVAIALLIVALPVMALKGGQAEEDLKKFRPKVEAVIEPKALEDPVYLILTLTLVSFVVAGLREELWRAGVLAGLAKLAPNIFASRKGQYLAVVVAAVVFGIGHMAQGFGGVFLTALLGIGLGAIMVWRQSIWEAALAHGFFNASTFAMLYVVIKFFPEGLKALGTF